jgi:DNA-binding beta-propeller fold protein YncE
VGANGSNVVKITPGAVVTNYSSGTFTSPTALAYDDTRNMVVVGDSSSGTVYGITQSGGTVTLGTGAGTIAGIVTANGTIYIYDSGGSLKSVMLRY